jgi:transcription initiation factor IIE alpha subunit
MADVPHEAVQFARMAVRAFYSEDYVVVVDGVLRRNNFCSHSDLARALHAKPKDLRKICARMVAARLLCSEKRQQRRINYKDSKHPARLVNTEFWFVPLCELVDAFQYRMHHILRELDESIRKESEQDRYICEKCFRRYKLVDICANVNPDTGEFFCDAMAYNRVSCNGIIHEEDNSSVLKETENFKKRFEDELRPICGLADVCARMHIPKHPLEGADEATWALYVPETVGVHGEVVDAEGLTADVAAELSRLDSVPAEDAAAAVTAEGLDLAIAASAADAGVIPERPDWFKESKKDDDDLDDDWEDENEAVAQSGKVSHPSFGTAASFGDNSTDAKSYLEMYTGVVDDSDDDGKDSVAFPSSGVVSTLTASRDGVLDDTCFKTVSSEMIEPDDLLPASKVVAEIESPDMPAVVGENEEVVSTVFVQGKIYAVGDITDDLIDKMTPDEYQGMLS